MSELRLDSANIVPGRNGLTTMAYVRYIQTWKGLDVDGGDITFSIKLLPSGSKVVKANANLFPEIKTLETSFSISSAQCESLVKAKAGPKLQSQSLRSSGKKIKFLKGKWRTVEELSMEETGVVAAVDTNGETILWDGKSYFSGNAKGRGVILNPKKTENNLDKMNLIDLKIQGPVSTVYTDTNGNYTLNDTLTSNITLNLTGKWSTVSNSAGNNLTFSIPSNASNPFNILVNPTGNNEFVTVQVNAYVHVTKAHNWMISKGINDSSIDYSVETKVNGVNNCQASQISKSITFSKSGSGCINTAYDTIAYHEYGHFVDGMIGGKTNLGLSEGWGDLVATYITGQPLIGEEFGLRPYQRTADNSYKYDPRDRLHTLGQSWAGFAWHLRENLIASKGQSAGIALAEDLVIPTFYDNAEDIPAAVLAVAIRDDNDGDLSNGSPNFNEILDAATQHRLQDVLLSIPPKVKILNPGNGTLVAGTITISGTASDDVLLDNVKYKMDSGSYIPILYPLTSWSRAINTLTLANGVHTLTVKATDSAGLTATHSIQIDVQNNVSDNFAIYDTSLKVPVCNQNVGDCDSNDLLISRGNQSGTPEPNQPNTIHDSCTDKSNGGFHSSKSLDALRVTTLDGTNFEAGKTVTIEADIWASSLFTSEFLDLYYAADANTPVWTYIITLSPTKRGASTLQTNYILPNGSLQAIRGAFRSNGSASACIPVGSTTNDFDDLVFTLDSTPPIDTPLNLVTNPGFELEEQDWKDVVIDDTVFHNGSQSASLTLASEGTSIIHSFPSISGISDDASYMAEFWMKQDNVSTTSQGLGAAAVIVWLNDAFTEIRADLLTSRLGTSDWIKTSQSVTPPIGSTHALFALVLHKSVGTVWFDDVSLSALSSPQVASEASSLSANIDLNINFGALKRDDRQLTRILNALLQEEVPSAPVIDDTFAIKEHYAYPNPSQGDPVIHIKTGLADEVRIRVYNVAGERVHEATLNQVKIIDHEYAYEHKVTGLTSGVYLYRIEAIKGGQPLRVSGKMALIK